MVNVKTGLAAFAVAAALLLPMGASDSSAASGALLNPPLGVFEFPARVEGRIISRSFSQDGDAVWISTRLATPVGYGGEDAVFDVYIYPSVAQAQEGARDRDAGIRSDASHGCSNILTSCGGGGAGWKPPTAPPSVTRFRDGRVYGGGSVYAGVATFRNLVFDVAAACGARTPCLSWTVAMLQHLVDRVRGYAAQQQQSTRLPPASMAPQQHGTAVRVFYPFDAHGNLRPDLSVVQVVSGTCQPWSEATPADPDAYHCGARNNIYDPCFASAKAPWQVACALGPTDGKIILMYLEQPLPQQRDPVSPIAAERPWTLILADGDTCTFIQGATTDFVDGLRAMYECAHGTIYGDVDRSHEPWRALYWGGSLDTLPQKSQLTSVTIKTAWF